MAEVTQAKEFPIKNVIYIGGAVVGFIVVKKLLETLGIIQTAQERANEIKSGNLEQGSTGDTSTVNPSNPALALNPNYWKTILVYLAKKRKIKTVPAQEIGKLLNPGPSANFLTSFENWAGRVYSSKGFFNDDESRLYDIFQNMKSQIQVSYLSLTFSQKYKKDMLDYIKGFTNEEERAKIYDIIRNKALY